MNTISGFQPSSTTSVARSCGCGPTPRKPESAPADQVTLSAQPAAAAAPAAQQPPSQQPPSQQPPSQQPPAPSPTVKVNIYAQDPWVAGPMTVDFERSKIGTDLSGERVRITDWGQEKARPDADGNYLLAPNTPGISQVNAQVVTYNTLDLFESFRGGKINWAFGSPTLEVVPHKQEGKNAYYSRWEQSTNFFYFDSPELNAHVKTANSTDVVSHETGHAILDGLRPGYFGTSDPETGAFHEAFGDCAAMLLNLQDASNRGRVLAQTGGNLRVNNNLSALAEEFGKATKLANTDPSDDNRFWLRNGNNNFTYKPANELPAGRGDEFTLGREVHSFSRLFSGAFYDVLEKLFIDGVYQEKMCPNEALKFASDTAGPLLVRGIETSPANRGRFKDVALGMIRADQEKNGGKFSQLLKDVFLKREIIKPSDLSAEANRQIPDVRLEKPLSSGDEAVAFASSHADALGLPSLPLEPLGVYTNQDGEQFVTLQYKKEVPVTVQGLEDHTVDVSGGVTMVFGADGQLKDYTHTEITPEVVQNEMNGLEFLMKQGSVLDEQTQQENPFLSSNGKPYRAVARGGKIERVPISQC